MTHAETIDRRAAEVLAPRRTSVPTWTERLPPLDTSGRQYLAITVGAGAAEAADRWRRQAADTGKQIHVLHLQELDPRRRPEVLKALTRLRVGARIAVAGDEADVLEVGTWCAGAGVLPEELLTHAVSRTVIAVFCVHCENTRRVRSRPGELLTCTGCGRRIEVHEHTSRHRGSYLASATSSTEGS
ncbi:dimethylamine monooxygenase subunit DmmA family protein [Kineococcus arenarius]|uniref:dimethylamine monooxygenase subunit DmmA family protein n=1 Tax=unclassified Kineococcus TaxID=2621656 RepID=UPI003D7EE3CC